MKLRYGNESIFFDLPDHADILCVREPEKKIRPDLLRHRLAGELKHVNEKSLHSVAIAVADKTRRCAYPEYLPVLVETLTDFGVDPRQISFYIAYGTHSRQKEEESRSVYGECYGRFRFVHHDCDKRESFISLGRTSRGTPVMIHREIYPAAFFITFGVISHHYFAGYGGGRKLNFPGLGFRDSIYHNHGLFLDRELRSPSPQCRPGVIDGNPLAEDLAEYEAFFAADMSIHGISDSQGNVCDLLVGRGNARFREACDLHGKNCEIRTEKSYDTVLASCGGSPKDINMIQSHKAIHNAAAFVRDGGTLIISARCPEGVGSETFLPWFERGSYKNAFDRLAAQYEGNGGTALAMMAKTERIQILMITELGESIAGMMGVGKISAESARKMIADSEGSLAVIPNAALLVRR